MAKAELFIIPDGKPPRLKTGVRLEKLGADSILYKSPLAPRHFLGGFNMEGENKDKVGNVSDQKITGG